MDLSNLGKEPWTTALYKNILLAKVDDLRLGVKVLSSR